MDRSKSTSPMHGSTDTNFEMMENPMRKLGATNVVTHVGGEAGQRVPSQDKRDKKKKSKSGTETAEEPPIAAAGGEAEQRVPRQDKRERDGSRARGGSSERHPGHRSNSRDRHQHRGRNDWEDINLRLRELEDKLAAVAAAAAESATSKGEEGVSRGPAVDVDEFGDDRTEATHRINERHWENRDVKVRFFSEGYLACSMHTKRYFQTHIGHKCRWVQVPPSVYGATVEALLRQRELSVFYIFYLLFNVLGACLVTFAMQIYILWRLWISLPELHNNDSFCLGSRIGKPLQLCAVGAFLLSVGDAFNDIFVELNIVFTSKQLAAEPKSTDVNIIELNKKTGRKWFADELVRITALTSSRPVKIFCLLLIFLEFLVFISVIMVGVNYLLVQDTVSNLIQASVAIVFLNDMDNMAYNAIMPDGFKDDISKQYFETPNLKKKGKKRATAWMMAPDGNGGLDAAEPADKPRGAKFGSLLWLKAEMEEAMSGGARGRKDTAAAEVFYYVAMMGALSILLGSSMAVVYGLHNSYC